MKSRRRPCASAYSYRCRPIRYEDTRRARCQPILDYAVHRVRPHSGLASDRSSAAPCKRPTTAASLIPKSRSGWIFPDALVRLDSTMHGGDQDSRPYALSENPWVSR